MRPPSSTVACVTRFAENWDGLQRHFIARDDTFGLYDGLSFREQRLWDLIAARRWDWPHTEHGRPELKLQTLVQQARRYPELKPWFELRDNIAELRLSKLVNTIGNDGSQPMPNASVLDPYVSVSAIGARQSVSAVAAVLAAWPVAAASRLRAGGAGLGRPGIRDHRRAQR